MANIVVLGTGLVGKAIALDLARQHDVLAVDCNQQALEELISRNSTVKTKLADLSNPENISGNIIDADIVVSAVPGHMGYKTLQTIIRGSKNVVDIAFFPEDASQLDSLAKEHHVTAIVDMGVAPGLSHLVLGRHAIDIQIERFKCMVGGLPKKPRPPFNYKAPFSPVDVVEEYTRPARLVRNGKVLTLPALSEIESVDFPSVGTLEAFNTDGLRSLIYSFPDIPDMVEKTLRYPGHAKLMQTLRDIGYLDTKIIDDSDTQLNPLQISTELFKKHWKLEKDEPEFTVMRIELSGKERNGAGDVDIRYDLYDEYDEQTGISSMARTTGYMCTAGVNLVLGNIFTDKGIIPPEKIGQDTACYQSVLNYYAERGVQLVQVNT